MKVYVVFEKTMISIDGEINESKVHGVYSNKEDAESYSTKLKKELNDKFEDWEDIYDYEPEWDVNVIEMEVK